MSVKLFPLTAADPKQTAVERVDPLARCWKEKKNKVEISPNGIECQTETREEVNKGRKASEEAVGVI